MNLSLENFDFAGCFKARVFVESAVWEDAIIVESVAKVSALSGVANFRKSITKLGLGATIDQFHCSDLDVTFYKVVFDVEVSNAAHFVGVAGQQFSTGGVRVHLMRGRWLSMEKFQSVFDWFQEFDAR